MSLAWFLLSRALLPGKSPFLERPRLPSKSGVHTPRPSWALVRTARAHRLCFCIFPPRKGRSWLRERNSRVASQRRATMATPRECLAEFPPAASRQERGESTWDLWLAEIPPLRVRAAFARSSSAPEKKGRKSPVEELFSRGRRGGDLSLNKPAGAFGPSLGSF